MYLVYFNKTNTYVNNSFLTPIYIIFIAFQIVFTVYDLKYLTNTNK